MHACAQIVNVCIKIKIKNIAYPLKCFELAFRIKESLSSNEMSLTSSSEALRMAILRGINLRERKIEQQSQQYSLIHLTHIP